MKFNGISIIESIKYTVPYTVDALLGDEGAVFPDFMGDRIPREGIF
jgi:hypothetical protein